MRRLRQQRTLPPQCFQGDCLVILTIPVLLYQLLFVLALYIASRFGKAALNITTILCLLWTATHLFLVPLAVLQTVVIRGSHAVFRRRFRSPRSELSRTIETAANKRGRRELTRKSGR